MSTPTSDDSRLGKPSLTPPVSPRSGQPPPARTEPVTATDDAATTIKIMNRAFMYRLCAVRAPLGSGRIWLSRDRNTVCVSPLIHFHVAWATSVVHGRLSTVGRMRRSRVVRTAMLPAIAAAALAVASGPTGASSVPPGDSVAPGGSTAPGGSAAPADGGLRIATFNASLNRAAEGELVTNLSTPDDPQAAAV